jgi:hypothetical protein
MYVRGGVNFTGALTDRCAVATRNRFGGRMAEARAASNVSQEALILNSLCLRRIAPLSAELVQRFFLGKKFPSP